MKKIFFLVGMPRAGNTLLSSILNQNPDIAVTPNTSPSIFYGTSFNAGISPPLGIFPTKLLLTTSLIMSLIIIIRTGKSPTLSIGPPGAHRRI